MYRKIMVPLDGSELAECVLPHLEAIVKGCAVPEVIFTYAVEPFDAPLADTDYEKRIEQEAKSAARSYLKRLAESLQYENVSLKTEVIMGKAANSLADYAHENGIDLIIMATHGRSGIGHWFLGSVAEKVLHLSRAPVLMIRATETTGKS